MHTLPLLTAIDFSGDDHKRRLVGLLRICLGWSLVRGIRRWFEMNITMHNYIPDRSSASILSCLEFSAGDPGVGTMHYFIPDRRSSLCCCNALICVIQPTSTKPSYNLGIVLLEVLPKIRVICRKESPPSILLRFVC